MAKIRRQIKYSPLPSQIKFMNSTSRHVGFVGGYGSGKTYIAAYKAVQLASRNPGCRGAIVSPTYPMMRDTMLPTLIEQYDNLGIPYTLKRAEMIMDFPEMNSSMFLRSADNPVRLKGLNLGWCIIDEAAICKSEVWDVMISRTRDKKATFPQICITTTPEGFNWVYDLFSDPQDGYETVHADTRQNKHLPSEYISDLEESYDKKLVQAYLEGKFVSLGVGVVYHSFDRTVHVVDRDVSSNLAVHVGIDFNVAPMLAEAFQIENGVTYGVHEFFINDNAGTRDMARLIKNKFKIQHDAGKLFLYPDSSGDNRRTSGDSDIQILREELPRAVFCHDRSNPPVKDRINSVNASLRSANEKISLFVSPLQKQLVKDLESVSWAETRLDIDKRDKDRTHASDAAGYVIQKLKPLKTRATMANITF